MKTSRLAPWATLPIALLLCASALANPPDPSTHVDYGCYAVRNYTWNDGSGTGNVAGRLYHPAVSQGGSCTTNWPNTPSPLVVIAHGNGFLHTAYSNLAVHLARNGFAVVSVNTGNLTSASDRADKLITYIHGMFNYYSGASNLSDQISLIGHSRGGEGVVAAAIKSRQQARPWTVRAVVALAPTDVGVPSDLNLSFDASRSLLTLVSSRDGDVVGRCVGDHPSCNGNLPLQQPGTGFALHDRAGGWSLAAPEPTQWMNKALVFLHGAIHACYADTPFGVSQGPGTLSCAAQREVSRGFVTAFLRWQVLGESAYRPFISGELALPALSANNVEVRQQFQAFGPRVLDDFENGLWSQNALGGAVSEMNLALSEGTAFQLDSFAPLPGLHYSVPHDRGAMLVRWSGNAFLAKALHSDLPFAQRNVAGWSFFSLRAAQLYASSLNPGGTLSFRITLRDIDGGSAFVNLSSYGGLREQEQFNLVTNEGNVGHVGGNYSKTALETFRIPLADFPGVDLSRLQRVTLSFSGASGEILIDDLSFTH